MAITTKKDACVFCEKKRIKKQNRDVSTAINKRALGGMLIPYYVGRVGQIGKFIQKSRLWHILGLKFKEVIYIFETNYI